MANNKSKQVPAAPLTPVRPIDLVITNGDAAFKGNSFTIVAIITPILWFGLFALLWVLPFPELKFLGRYNAFINWASFLLAISVFAYYKLSPMLSYFVLFTFFAYSYIITALQEPQVKGGLSLIVIALLLIGLSLIALIAAKPATVSWSQWLRQQLTAPVYLWAKVLKTIKLRY